jgi:hypothetical protein
LSNASRLCLAAIVTANAINVISSVGKAKVADDAIIVMAIVAGMPNSVVLLIKSLYSSQQ